MISPMPDSTPSDSTARLLHDLPAVTVRAITVSEMQNNVFLLTSKTTGAQVLIDAADDAAAIKELLASAAGDTPCDTRLDAIITTHQHWDHIRALAQVAGQHGQATVSAGEPDAAAITAETGVETNKRLHHGDLVAVDGVELTVIALRGHTPGSIALAYEPGPDEATVIFTGDSLFPGGVGNTDKEPQRFRQLLDDVTHRLFEAYPDDTHIHPGHGNSTTLGAERPHVKEWAERGW